MKISASRSFGGSQYQFVVEDEDLKALHKAIVLTNPRTHCDECGNHDPDLFRFDSNKGGGYFFVNTVCIQCGAKSKLGQYQDGGYFWREFEKYRPDEGAQ